MSAHYSSRLRSEFIMVAGWSTYKKQQNGDLTINLNPCGPQANHNFGQFTSIQSNGWQHTVAQHEAINSNNKYTKKNVTQQSDSEKWSSRFQLRTCSMHTGRLSDANAFHHLHTLKCNSHTWSICVNYAPARLLLFPFVVIAQSIGDVMATDRK